MRKIGVLFIAFIMAITSVDTVWAQSRQSNYDRVDSADNSLNEELTLTEVRGIMKKKPHLKNYSEDIFEDVDNFDDMYFTSCGDIVEIDRCDERLTYSVNYGRVVDTIQVLKRTDHYSEYQVVEGNKTDSIRYFNNGIVMINGQMYDNNGDNSYIHSDDYEDWFQTKCPYGKISDYTYKIGTKNNPNVANSQYINNLTYTGLSFLLSTHLAFVVCPHSGLICGIVSWVYALLSYDDTPYTKSMSFKLVKYNHKEKKGGIVKGTLSATRYYITPYAFANYQYKLTPYNTFYCKERYC